MKRILIGLIVLTSLYSNAQTKNNLSGGTVRTISFDKDWLFIKDSTINAGEVNFDDSKWRKLDLPHDWSIEDLPNQIPDSIVGPFHKGSPGSIFTGFTIGGAGWYRKKFITEKSEQNKIVTIHFDRSEEHTSELQSPMYLV